MEYRITPKYFEELNVGDKFYTPGRTVTEADVVNYAAYSGDYNPIHTDEQFARTTQFGKRLVHGPLTVSIALGLMFRLGVLDINSQAMLSLNSTFKGPVFIGDTIHCVVEVIEKRLTRRGDRGILSVRVSVLNQKDEVVIETVQTEMHACKPK